MFCKRIHLPNEKIIYPLKVFVIWIRANRNPQVSYLQLSPINNDLVKRFFFRLRHIVIILLQ